MNNRKISILTVFGMVATVAFASLAINISTMQNAEALGIVNPGTYRGFDPKPDLPGKVSVSIPVPPGDR